MRKRTMRAGLESGTPSRGSNAGSDTGAISGTGPAQWPIWFQRTVTAAFVLTLVVAVDAAIIRMLAFPHGDGWDAFAIWNLHARFLFLGGMHWRDGFSALAGGSHPDYPLLLPGIIAHFWALLGRDDARVPAMISLAFTFATAAVLFAAVWIVRGRVQAMMAAMALLSTPLLIQQGAAQYADVPLSFFFLASAVMLCLFDFEAEGSGRSGLLVLASFAATFAAWTKNEGLLFLCSLMAARLVVFLLSSRPSLREQRGGAGAETLSPAGIVPLLAVLIPGLILVAGYKHSIRAAGDLFSDPSTALAKLTDLSRYWVVVAGYAKGFFRFGHWLWIPGTVVLLALAVACGMDTRFTRQPGFRTSTLALIVTLAGYFGVFLVTPYDIHWHLRFSLVRLFLQLWPSALFLFFIALAAPRSR